MILIRALGHLAHHHFRVEAWWNPKNLADFLALCARCHRELDLQRKAALAFPIELPFHRTAVEYTPFEVGNVLEQNDFGEGLFLERAHCALLGVFENLVFVIAQHDVEEAAAALDGGKLNRLGNAFTAGPVEAERDILQSEIREVVRALVVDLQVEARVAGQR